MRRARFELWKKSSTTSKRQTKVCRLAQPMSACATQAQRRVISASPPITKKSTLYGCFFVPVSHRWHKQEFARRSLCSRLEIVPDFAPCSVIASVSASEPKQSIFLFLDKNGLLLTANRRSRNDSGYILTGCFALLNMTVRSRTGISKNILAAHCVRGSVPSRHGHWQECTHALSDVRALGIVHHELSLRV